uniref:Protein arginine methyltransferase NDUFAF7 n=2 Tax=Aegilops tauschii subsp. strangulata TaxID=200361 RepID=A0A453G9J0_AEGTS
QPCWVLMLEVLDNLPHDLVYSPDQVSPWMEVWIEKVNGSSQVCEVYKPLQDPLVSRCSEIVGMNEENPSLREKLSFAAKGLVSKVFPKPRRAWLPTGCLKLLDTLHQTLPSMSLIASDFSYLPDVSIPGDRAPLVSSKRKMGKLWIIPTILMHRAMQISSSQPISCCWSRSTTTALVSRKTR